MEAEKPTVVMVAGPNGAGKSSIAPGILAKALRLAEYVNADMIARGLAGFNPDLAAVAAGRVMLERLDELARENQPFAFETTGASRSFLPRIRRLRETGYSFLLTYIWVRSPDISVERVAQRVKLGGHNVPEKIIRRRYFRGLLNSFGLYLPIADEWQFYDNSAAGDAILVVEGGAHRTTVVHGKNTWQTILQMAEWARLEE